MNQNGLCFGVCQESIETSVKTDKKIVDAAKFISDSKKFYGIKFQKENLGGKICNMDGVEKLDKKLVIKEEDQYQFKYNAKRQVLTVKWNDLLIASKKVSLEIEGKDKKDEILPYLGFCL